MHPVMRSLASQGDPSEVAQDINTEVVELWNPGATGGGGGSIAVETEKP